MPTQRHMSQPAFFFNPEFACQNRSQGFLTPQADGSGMSPQDYFHYQVVDRPQSAGPHMGFHQQMLMSQAMPTPSTSPKLHGQRHMFPARDNQFLLRLQPQHFVPSTPSLSTSRSSLSSQSVDSPAMLHSADLDYFGQKHCADQRFAVESMPLLGSTHSPPMSPGMF